jgi:hypothetical protein
MVVKRAMVHPGYVKSQNDGDIHWITGHDLIALYRPNPHTTRIYTPSMGGVSEYADQYNHYYPRQDGNYERR